MDKSYLNAGDNIVLHNGKNGIIVEMRDNDCVVNLEVDGDVLPEVVQFEDIKEKF